MNIRDPNMTQNPLDQVLDLNLWFIRLRWVACGVALVLVVLTIKVLHLLTEVTFWPLLGLIGLLAISNLVYTLFVKRRRFISHLREMQIVSDLVILTLMLHFSGGIENPLSFIYLFHVILSGILLEKKRCFAVVGLAFFLYTTLALTELYRVVPHYTLQIFPHALIEQHHTAPEASAPSPDREHDPAHSPEGEKPHHLHASHYPVYVSSMIILELFILTLTAYFITNIMDRLREEQQRTREERQRLEHVLQATGAGLLILDKQLRPIWFNEPIVQWFGAEITNRASVDETLREWIGYEDGVAAQTLRDGQIRSVEQERIDPEGHKQFFQVTVAPLIDPGGKIYQVVELIQDITEKKILEAEMIHAARVVTLGTMAAGIAHEVGNPLASMSTRLHLMTQKNDPEFLRQSVELIRKEIHRIERIVRGISQFGKPSQESWTLCRINQIISETVEMLRYHKSARQCQIHTQLDPNLPSTLGVRDQLKQAFINLGLNALEAMPRGGQLTITSGARKGNISIEFIDTGQGIEPEVLKKIFQPFYTTKEKGSGLGLFIVNHIIQAHGGRIDVETNPGEGTRFTVHLPIHRSRRVPNTGEK
ncbi:MAG: PAS domain-containing protein [Calditrichaeota bacterium]|nr:MAG: PAS domain-containing protein [Calditrichota bacterium]